MAILAGIDEAGFGPLLGPLVVSATAFRVPDGALGGCLWKALRQSCTKKTGQSAKRLVIADSKQLYHSSIGLGGLERAALVMLATAAKNPRTWRSLVAVLAPELLDRLTRHPWYDGADFDLPADDGTGDIALRANAVARTSREAGVTFLGAASEPLTEGDYNDLVRRLDNKSSVLLTRVMKLVHRLTAAWPDEPIRIQVDRLGGRSHYREALMMTLPGWELSILEETDARSAYRLRCGGRVCEIEFLVDGDARCFAVALASIYSKYLRELFMKAFNAWWSQQAPGLAPTAGYYTDARRWLSDADETIVRLGVDRGLLVRER